MEITDLTIDNWIHYNFLDEDVQVKGIGNNCIWINESGPISSSHFSPISLTRDKIWVMGFREWNKGRTWTKGKCLIYETKKDGISFGKASTRTKLKYLHQLQNLDKVLNNK